MRWFFESPLIQITSPTCTQIENTGLILEIEFVEVLINQDGFDPVIELFDKYNVRKLSLVLTTLLYVIVIEHIMSL